MAGSNAVASGAAILTTNADGLKAGLEKGAQQVQTWGTRVAGSLNNVFSAKGGTMGALQGMGGAVTSKLAGLAAGAKGLLSGAGTAIGTALGGPIGAAIGTAVGSALGAVGETIVGALAAPFERLDIFKGIVKQADSLGIATEAFQGLTQVMSRAGISGDQVGQVFATMGKQIADVASGHGRGAALAFEKLGLSAEQLIAMKPDQQFLAIAEAFAKMPAGAEQASAAVHLFGGNAAAMLPELQKGRAGYEALLKQGLATGTILSDSQARAAADASKAWAGAKKIISDVWTGLQNRAMQIATPIIKFVGNAVQKIYTFIVPVFEWVGRAIGRVADITSAVFNEVVKWFEQGVKWLQELGGELDAFAGGWPTIQDVVVSVFRAIGTASSYAWDTVKAGSGAVAVALGFMVEKALAPVVAAFRDLIGLTKELPAYLRPDWLDGMNAALDKADASVSTIGKKMQDWGKNAVNGFGESAKQFNKWLDKLKFGASGAPDLNPTPPKPPEKPEFSTPQLSAAMLRGSKEAYSVVLRNRLGGMETETEKLNIIGKGIKKGNDLKKEGNKKLDGIENVLNNLGAI